MNPRRTSGTNLGAGVDDGYHIHVGRGETRMELQKDTMQQQLALKVYTA